jgi:hypothetical protein
MKVGDLVVNTYVGAVLRGKLGLVVGLSRYGCVLVMYGNQVQPLGKDCLEVVSESR